ncbi:hypothetical protein COB57_04235 [Candidatus Peregrinibacteria bacterium]|nr:MAG: hypothetical protein COB57_04235 [Candidatus Peregrinibacteria bacterium]
MSAYSLFLPFIENLQHVIHVEGIFPVLLKILLIYIIILWISLVVWVFRDVIHRSNNILFQVFSVLLNTLLPVFGLFIYLLIRSNRTLMEKYYEERELHSFSGDFECHACQTVIQEEHEYCFYCGEGLHHDCNHCKKMILLSFDFCTYCGEKKGGKKKIVKKKK